MTLSAEERGRVFHAVEASALLRNVRRLDGPALEGEVTVEGQETTLRLVLGDGFPAELPAIFLHRWDVLGFLPHVLPSGYVCYQETEGILLDRSRPLAIIRDALDRALSTLSDGVSGRNKRDFVDEFETYWHRFDYEPVWSLLEPSAEPSKVISATTPKKLRFVCREASDVAAFWNGDIRNKYTYQRVFYVPFKPGTLIVPPRHDQPFWSAKKIRELVWENITASTARWLKKATRGRVRQSETVAFCLPRPSGGAVIFGIRYAGVQGRHPLLEGGSVERLHPLRCRRLDRTYLLPRGGARSSLCAKRVLLVGCGAVGGHLAFECARAGILDLTLVDADDLNVENTFRHVLGRGFWFENKAEALKKEIEKRLPYVHVTAVRKRIEDGLKDEDIDFANYDLVLLALGTPTVELDLNERLQALEEPPPALFTWLEPYGIGGHALVTNNALETGCFECLYTQTGNGGTFGNRAAFAALGQHFGKALSGCGSLFTPYGSIDAVRTATLAAQLAVDVLLGQERGNALLSWKGNARAFREAEFVTSARFEFSEERLFQDRYAYVAPECLACGRGNVELG